MTARPLALRRWVADLMTLANGVFGALSIATWSVELGPLSSLEDRYVAAAYIGLGLIADGFDGIVARRWGSTGLGNSLDAMSDCVTFCVAPAVFLLESHSELGGTPVGAATAAVALVFLVAGMLRLARQQGAPESATFTGLPTPWSGGALVALLLLGTPPWILLAAAGGLAALNLSRVRYPKSRGAMGRLAVVVLCVAVLVIAGMLGAPHLAPVLVGLGVAMAAVMVLLGPLFARRAP